MKFSERANRIKPSATLEVGALAKKLKSEGHPVISFSMGEPDFVSSSAALTAAKEAIDRGETHYTVSSGLAELKTEVGEYYKRHFGLEYKNSEIIIASGAKPTIFEAMQALVDKDDEVLVFAPAWVSYVEQIVIADGKAVVVETHASDNFEPTKEAIERVLTKHTVGMIINTPNNPTGAAYSENCLRMIADVAKEHDLWIVFDEIYERLVYGETKHHNIVNVAPEIRDRVLIVNGVSKAFCMTGWRIGYALGPEPLIKKLDMIQGHLTSNAASISQWAAIGALKGGEDDAEKSRQAFEKRRDLTYGLLKEIKGLKIEKPTGAFYAFFDVRGTKIPDDQEFCKRLLADKYVAMVPGSAFFAPGFVRMSYACADEDIKSGIARLKEFVESL